MKLPDNASGKWGAVKKAVAQLAEGERLDNPINRGYDEENTFGGNEYGGAQGLSGTSETGLPGRTGAERVRTRDPGAVSISGQAPGGMGTAGPVGSGRLETGSGSYGFRVQLRISPVLCISDRLSAAQQEKGTPTYSDRDTSGQPQAYEAALNAGRASDVKNGWCVTPKTA